MSPRGFKKNLEKPDGYKQTTLGSYFSSQKSSSHIIKSELVSHSGDAMTSNARLVKKIHKLRTVGNGSFSHSQTIIANENTETIQHSSKLPVPLPQYRTFQKEFKPEQVERTPSKTNKETSSNPATPKKLKLSPKKEILSSRKESSLIENARMPNLLKKIVDTILSQSRYRALLDGNEEKQIKIILNMNSSYQYFLCKLVTKKHIWYNIFKLAEDPKMNMTESEIRKMYDELQMASYIDTDYSTEELSYLLGLLPKEEIVLICKNFKVLHKGRHKQDLVNKLLNRVNSQQSCFSPVKSTSQVLRQNINKVMGCSLKLNENFYNLLYKFYVLYFLTDNSRLNIAEWNYLTFQIDQKEIIYPEFKVDEDFIIFTSREEFEEYVKSYALYQSAVIANGKKERALLLDLCKTAAQELNTHLRGSNECSRSPILRRFSAGYVYAHTISSNIEYLLCKYPEDTYHLLECLFRQNLYKQTKRGFWYEKLAWIEWKYFNKHEQAISTLTRGLKDETITKVAKHDLSCLGRKFKEIKKIKLPNSVRDAICMNVIDPPDHVPFKETVINAVTDRENESGRKRKYIIKNDDGECTYMTVEDVAINYYRKEGFPNITKCEGQFLISLYRLSFWDIIYDDSVKGVFISKLQQFPLDFYTKQFYENRKTKIHQRLKDIETNWTKNQFKDFLNEICRKDQLALKLSEFVEHPMQLCEIIWCIDREKFAKICKRFVDEFYLFRSGLPDLFMWSVEKQKAKFVEVKGEGDRLSTKQMLWLNFFRSIEVDAEVCYVHSTGSRGGKKYKKKSLVSSQEN